MDAMVLKAFEAAKQARENAYAEYSNVRVGAALKVKGSDKIYAGSNVEFVVNGISVCAERTALGNAVTHQGKIELEFVVVCTNTEPVLFPCGVCIQAMSEFCGPDLPIFVANPAGIQKEVKFKDLFTHQYSELPKVLD